MGNPAAETAIFAVPALTPVTVAGASGVVLPCGKYTLLEMVAFDWSLLARFRNTPPDPAAEASVTGYCMDCPTPTARLDGVCIGAAPGVELPPPPLLTVTVTVVDAVEMPEVFAAVSV